MEKTAQYKVGDKVKVVKTKFTPYHHGYSVGDIFVIDNLFSQGVIVDGGNRHDLRLRFEEIELVSDKPTKNQRITALEEAVEQLKARVEQLEAQQSPTQSEQIARKLSEALTQTPSASANSQRKAIIDEAKAFVKKYVSACRSIRATHEGNGLLSEWDMSPKFEVNEEKRAVVVLLYRTNGGALVGKGIAKCAPDDVFNADIGKAIALGRALGLDVERFEQAPQPDYYVIGHVITLPRGEYEHGKWNYRVDKIAESGQTLTKLFDDGSKSFANTACTQYYETQGKNALPIIDDTEAQY